MAPTSAPVDAAWRSFFEDAASDDVAALVRRYPEERSIYVDVVDLHRHDADLVEALFADPDAVLRRGAATLQSAADALDRVNVRLRNLPSQLAPGSVGSRHRSTLVTVDGVVDSIGAVEAKVTAAVFQCGACGALQRERPRGIELPDPGRCDECGSSGAFALDRSRSTFVDLQWLVVSDPVGPGDEERQRRTLTAFLDDDLVGTVAPDESVLLTGIVRLDGAGAANRFDVYLDGVAVDAGVSGQPEADVDVPEQLKESIRSRWEFVMDG